MNLEIRTPTELGEMIKDDTHMLHEELDNLYAPTIFFPDLAHGKSNSYTLTKQGTYENIPSQPYGDNTCPCVYRPCLEPIYLRQGEKPTGVHFYPTYVDVLSPLGKPASLCCQAYVAAGPKLLDTLHERGSFPHFLRPNYVHLRYKILQSKRGIQYKYQSSWEDGVSDVRSLFPLIWKDGEIVSSIRK